MNRSLFVAAFAALALPLAAIAQEWPAKPVRMIVPFPPGGSTDAVARLIAQRLSDKLGQQFLVDNRPGAAGNIGTGLVAKAAPDGYTIGMTTSGPLANNKFLYKTMPFDAEKDLAPVILVGEIPLVVVSNPSLKAANLKEFIALARATPGKLTVGNPGSGTIGHLAFELMKMNAKADIVGVPYKGDTPALTDLMGGSIDAISAPITAFIPHIQSGKLRGLAVTSKQRFPGLPNVPTAAEQGIDLEATVWFAIVVPAGTPKPIISKLNSEIAAIIRSQEGHDKLLQFGLVVAGGSPERLSELIATESAKWKRVVETANVKVE